TMLEVKAQTKDRRYSVMVTNKKEDTATLIYSEKPRGDEVLNTARLFEDIKEREKEKRDKK
ncbi:MAG: hypothetical protein K2L69_07855, partial [Muribaculaceae bacterium]|nr:hypothetical protein [Muribaculaceae bacterium]